MNDHEQAKSIEEMKAKTYAYFSSVINSILSAYFALTAYLFTFNLNDYLTYHNGDDNGGKLHDVGVNGLWVMGFAEIILLALIFLVVRFQIKRIKQIENKIPPIIVSSLLFAFLLPVSGYLIILFHSLF